MGSDKKQRKLKVRRQNLGLIGGGAAIVRSDNCGPGMSDGKGVPDKSLRTLTSGTTLQNETDVCPSERVACGPSSKPDFGGGLDGKC